MRIRKRFHNLPAPADLSSPPPVPSTGAAPPAAVSAAAGAKEGEAIEATSGKLSGPGGGGGAGGGPAAGGRGLHSNGDLPPQPLHGCTTRPISFLHFRPPLPEAAIAEGAHKGDLPAAGPLLPAEEDVPFVGEEAPERERDGDRKGGDGNARGRWNTTAHGGAAAAAPKSGCSSKIRFPGVDMHPKERDTGMLGDVEGTGFLRETSCRALGQLVAAACEEEKQAEDMGDERDIKPRRRNTRRNRPAASAAKTKAPTSVLVKEEEEEAAAAADLTTAAAPADGTKRGGGNVKKRRSPSVLMEGSRCSRVNGRGWRCCQQTLVGYSLCEHHLGKGRLRSVSSVRCNGRMKKKEEETPTQPPPPPLPQQQQAQNQHHRQQLLFTGIGADDDKEAAVILGKGKRRKIGTVKARSISSLLHQPDYSAPAAAAMAAAPEPHHPSSCSAPAVSGVIQP